MPWLTLIVTGAAVLVGYVQSRYFVRTKLRYVDAVQKGTAPLIAGAIAAVVVAVLPWVGIASAFLFGASVGLGVAAGAKDIRRGNAGLIEP